jgi:hypothetical protein
MDLALPFQERKIPRTVVVHEEDVLAVIAALDDVVRHAGHDYSGESGHGAILTETRVTGNPKAVPVPTYPEPRDPHIRRQPRLAPHTVRVAPREVHKAVRAHVHPPVRVFEEPEGEGQAFINVRVSPATPDSPGKRQ